MEKEPTLIKRIYKKLLIPVWALVSLTAIGSGGIIIFDKISAFWDDPVVLQKVEVTIHLGETKEMFKNDLSLITIDNISKFDETGNYRIDGKLNNGAVTSMIEGETQGESIIFDNYIVQIMKIASDYVEFRITKRNN